jgi:hypothetical protein
MELLVPTGEARRTSGGDGAALAPADHDRIIENYSISPNADAKRLAVARGGVAGGSASVPLVRRPNRVLRHAPREGLTAGRGPREPVCRVAPPPAKCATLSKARGHAIIWSENREGVR